MRHIYWTLAGVSLFGAALSAIVHVCWQAGVAVSWFDQFFPNTLLPLWIVAILTVSTNQQIWTVPPRWIRLVLRAFAWYMVLIVAWFVFMRWPLKSTGFESAGAVVFYGVAAMIFCAKLAAMKDKRAD